MTQPIIIETELNRDTLSEGIRAIMDNVLMVRLTKYLGYALIAGGILVYVSIVKLQSYAPLQAVIVGFMFIYFSRIMAYFNLRKIQSDDKVYEPLIYTFDTAKVVIRGTSFEGYFNWTEVKEVVETEKFFLIYQSTMAASILPKADFTQEQKERFRRLVMNIPGLKHNI